jgi:hypothetical protein
MPHKSGDYWLVTMLNMDNLKSEESPADLIVFIEG